jgi:hypothetical protein
VNFKQLLLEKELRKQLKELRPQQEELLKAY